MQYRFSGFQLTLIFCLGLLFDPFPVLAQEDAVGASVQHGKSVVQAESGQQIIQAFTSHEAKPSDLITVSEKRKRQVMFFLGVPLLLFILTTAVLGVAMGIYGKNVYVPHMIFAGLSVTLAIAHSIVGIVWFYPF